MVHQPSVDAIAKMEQHFQKLIELLNEADQAMQQVKLSNDEFEQAHEMNHHKGRDIDDAIASIENVLAQATTVHNVAVAHLREARGDAEQRTDDPDA